MSRLFVFGMGYAASHLAARLRGEGWRVEGTGRAGTVAFDDLGGVRAGVIGATHVLSSVPPDGGGDPVLARYGDAVGAGQWLGYLSSTGVYGDAGGAWVDETAPIGGGRRVDRATADAGWQARGARVFRLPGIYGPGRSPLDRVREGSAHLVASTNVFSRVHVDDIVSGVIAGFDGPAGAYNLADDRPCSPNDVVAFACDLLGVPLPEVVEVDTLSAMARGFYAEHRRISNAKAKRVLRWAPLYPDYRAGLRALSATASPIPVSAAPPTASGDQR